MNVFELLLNIVLPVFGIAGVGYYLAGRRVIDEASIATIVIEVSAPALVFHGLVSRRFELASLWEIGGGVVFASLVCGLAALIVFRALRYPRRGLYLAAMFPNTGNLGLPLALLAFGEAGLQAALVVFVAISLTHYSLGMMIVSGSAQIWRPFRTPLVIGALLGIGVAVVQLELPKPLLDFTDLMGQATVPLMLLGLGIRLRSVRVTTLKLPLLTVLLRMVPGLIAGLLWCWLWELKGVERAILLVTGVLPPAVMNFVLAEAHDQGAEEVAVAILFGTLISMGTIPALLAFLG